MNVFETHQQIVRDYASYIRSFINISDSEIAAKVEQELNAGKLWPAPLLQFNPAYEKAGTIGEVVKRLNLHPHLTDVFKGYSLYAHQEQSLRRWKEEAREEAR